MGALSSTVPPIKSQCPSVQRVQETHSENDRETLAERDGSGKTKKHSGKISERVVSRRRKWVDRESVKK